MLTQLFSHDAKDLDVAGIADHLIEQEEDVGTAIKSDGEQSDPLAFIGALPWRTVSPIGTLYKTRAEGPTILHSFLAGETLHPITKRVPAQENRAETSAFGGSAGYVKTYRNSIARAVGQYATASCHTAVPDL